MSAIKNTGIDHFLHETLSLERVLDFYLQENTFFKTRLSLVLENKMNREFIEKAEYFQTSFVNYDEHIKALKLDILTLQRILREFNKGKKTEEELAKDYNKLSNETERLSNIFNNLKSEFNQYLISFLKVN